MKALYIIVLLFILEASFSSHASAQESSDSQNEDARIERLVQLGHLWAQVAFFHPYLPQRNIDWDAAFVKHLPAIEKANSNEELSGALQALLDTLGDPVTRVVFADGPNGEQDYPDLLDDTQPVSYFANDSVLVIKMTDYVDLSDWANGPQRLRDAVSGISKAQKVIIDLRNLRDAGPEAGLYIDYMFSEANVASLLTNEPYDGPSTIRRIHYGYSIDGFDGGGVYNSGFVRIDGEQYEPNSKKSLPLVFLINKKSHIPDFAMGLQQKGSAVILSEGPISLAGLVNTRSIEFEYGVEVTLRLSGLRFQNGQTGFSPDSVLTLNPDENAALDKAINYARSSQKYNKQSSNRDSDSFEPMSTEFSAFPSREERLLAAFKIWNVAEHFFAYKHLMDKPWTSVLTEYLPEFEAATDSLDYVLTIARMITHLQDGHVGVRSPAFSEYLGRAPAPVWVRFIEEVPVVTGFRDDSVAVASGIKLGDEILEIDGRPVQNRINQLAPYLAASNSWAHNRYIAGLLLNGDNETVCRIKVQGEDGKPRTVELPRDRRFRASSYRSGEVIRVVDDNIGYVDLDRLTLAESRLLFSKLKDTKAIIFDMRGYPMTTISEMALRLGIDPEVPMAKSRLPIVEGINVDGGSALTYSEVLQFIRGPVDEVYEGPTVMLIDERAQSASEYHGMALVAANGTTLIGSETAGANGNVTYMDIPGGLSISFSGLDISFPDGTQLQRKGLQPDIRILPTIQGIRDGRDEVLEAAIGYLNDKTSNN